MIPILDRLVPSDWRHVERHPLRSMLATQTAVPTDVETILNIPRQYSTFYDQGSEGACVGFSQSWMMSILNRKRYAPRKLYKAAQEIDEWPGSDYSGTSLRAGFDVLREEGHWRVWDDLERPVELDEGIESNKWAQTVDEIRLAIHLGIPVNFGVNWYQEFGSPRQFPREGRGSPRYEYYIGTSTYWGMVLGGHAITCVGASDKRQAFALCNTWGANYPFLVWLPYGAMTRLFQEQGEAGVVVDRQ